MARVNTNGREVVNRGESTPAGAGRYLEGSRPLDDSFTLLAASLAGQWCGLPDHMVTPRTSNATCAGRKFRPTVTKSSGTFHFPGRFERATIIEQVRFSLSSNDSLEDGAGGSAPLN
ncbi:hypothetical protein EVAR_48171_1 [Eumeta japonica]|uniref:Uncharacterized protein n=1 Tax=Eumeta variegata TaxID=151549 RepID=A0A4C1WSW9_EUMVA|nr:hypothetical protein EVAR_48171_1 [Eumeta japonica]